MVKQSGEFTEPLTEAQIERLLDGHWNRNTPDEVCNTCYTAWPCLLRRAVDELRELRDFTSRAQPLLVAVETLTGKAAPKAPRWGLAGNVVILPKPRTTRG